MSFRCLFHVHTHYSFDSILPPHRIVTKARELHVDALVVTDHNTIRGAVETRRIVQGRSPLVVVAAEYQSEKGDIIGLFLEREIHSRDAREIAHQIHAQGGLVVLPHPYKGHKLDDELLAAVDIIETFNGRCSAQENDRASQLAAERHLPSIAGADAHCSPELGSVVNEYPALPATTEAELRTVLLASTPKAISHPSSPLWHSYSQLIKAVKMKNPDLFLYQTKRLVFTLARREGRHR